MTKLFATALAIIVLSLATTALANDARQRAQMLDYCMRKAELSNHAPSGNVVIALEIASSGMISHASIESSTATVPELAECSLRMIRRWRFPPQSASWNTTYTVVYSQSGQQALLR